MVIAGAGGHARELMGILAGKCPAEELFFFDDVNSDGPGKIWDQFPVIRTVAELKKIFSGDARFAIGVGKPAFRKLLCEKLLSLGGELCSVIAPNATIGSYNVELGAGLNIMPNAVITQDIRIGKGCLIHVNAAVHHDCRVGQFCELSPGSNLLGNVLIGESVSVGAGAIVLPGITVGDNAVIGAGSVVTRNVAAGSKVRGVPARSV